MAFTQTQTSTHATGSGSTVDITVSSTTFGNIVVVHVRMASNAETCTGVTDNKGNIYTLSAVKDSGTAARSYQAYAIQIIPGVTTITVSFSAAAVSKRCGADEYHSSIPGLINYETGNSGSGSGTTYSTSAFTPTAGDLVVSTLTQDGVGSNYTAGSGYTLYNGTGQITMRSQYRLSSTTSETAPATGDNSANWTNIASAFRLIPDFGVLGGEI